MSKKVGNAVIRNKTKRKFRAIARDLKIEKGWFLFLAKPSIVDITFTEMQKDIKKCLLRLKV